MLLRERRSALRTPLAACTQVVAAASTMPWRDATAVAAPEDGRRDGDDGERDPKRQNDELANGATREDEPPHLRDPYMHSRWGWNPLDAPGGHLRDVRAGRGVGPEKMRAAVRALYRTRDAADVAGAVKWHARAHAPHTGDQQTQNRPTPLGDGKESGLGTHGDTLRPPRDRRYSDRPPNTWRHRRDAPADPRPDRRPPKPKKMEPRPRSATYTQWTSKDPFEAGLSRLIEAMGWNCDSRPRWPTRPD